MNLKKPLILIASFIISYYLAILLHEWGHGTVAWLYGYKNSPFDVDYGGWLLLRADENVPYSQILASHDGFAAAMIGIAGLTVSLFLFLVAIYLLRKIQGAFFYSLLYWFAAINMVPIFQYLIVQTFSKEGDVGRFVYGLAISPWWVFVPGVIFVGFALFYFFNRAIPRSYAVIPIVSLWGRRTFLLFTIFVIFLMIYTHGYNPLSDKGMPLIGKVLAALSFLLVPILFFVCEPSREWVKKEVQKTRKT